MMDKNKVYEIVSDVLKISERELKDYCPSSSLEPLGYDSLNFIKIVVALEEAFDLEILDSDLLLNNFDTFDHIFEMLNGYLSGKIGIKKVLVTDCDNVLWRGVSGEEAIKSDKISLMYQLKLLELYKKGVLLCICSKNTSNNINNAFKELDMPITQSHFLIVETDTNSKYESIISISKQLDLSVKSFVFVDDSDYELGLVETMVSNVDVVKANQANDAWIQLLDSFFSAYSSDYNRTQQYIERKNRIKERKKFKSIADYNASLETTVEITIACSKQAARLSELSLRTTRFNLSSARYSQNEMLDFISSKDHVVIVLSAFDKFGDMGIVGCAILNSKKSLLEAFMLSCRAFDRGFEIVLLEKAKSIVSGRQLYGIYCENDQNYRFKNFYANNGVMIHEADCLCNT